MTLNEIKDLKKSKREYLYYIMLEYIKKYLYVIFYIRDNKEIRENLNIFINEYIEYHKLEKKLLDKIMKVRDINNEIVDDIIYELDDIFLKTFQYNEFVLNTYDNMIKNKQVDSVNILNKDYETLDDSKYEEYLKKISKIL